MWQLGEAVTKNPGYLKLRKIRAAQNIAKTVRNVHLAPTDQRSRSTRFFRGQAGQTGGYSLPVSLFGDRKVAVLVFMLPDVMFNTNS